MGHMIQSGKGYYVASALHGIYGCSVTAGGGIVNTYMLDAFHDDSTEMVIIAVMFKNYFFYQCSYWVNDHLNKVGPAQYFDVQGEILVLVYALSVPLYVLGGENRSFWSRHSSFRKWQIIDHA